jgi:hypothetical protein
MLCPNCQFDQLKIPLDVVDIRLNCEPILWEGILYRCRKCGKQFFIHVYPEALWEQSNLPKGEKNEGELLKFAWKASGIMIHVDDIVDLVAKGLLEKAHAVEQITTLMRKYADQHAEEVIHLTALNMLPNKGKTTPKNQDEKKEN